MIMEGANGFTFSYNALKVLLSCSFPGWTLYPKIPPCWSHAVSIVYAKTCLCSPFGNQPLTGSLVLLFVFWCHPKFLLNFPKSLKHFLLTLVAGGSFYLSMAFFYELGDPAFFFIHPHTKESVHGQLFSSFFYYSHKLLHELKQRISGRYLQVCTLCILQEPWKRSVKKVGVFKTACIVFFKCREMRYWVHTWPSVIRTVFFFY